MSLAITLVIGRDLARGQRAASTLRRLALVALSGVVYALQCWRGAQLVLQPDDAGAVSAIPTLIEVVYAVAVLRAWELVGAERQGLLGRLSLLRDLESGQ